MCGLAGMLDQALTTDQQRLDSVTQAMTETIHHRGPDAGAVWVDASAGIGLGHRRLSIIDLSPAGAQPMHSACGRYVLAYNGEAYNAEDLRPDLLALGYSFRGHSDTEILLYACAAWGVEEATRRLNGMFAFALWDRQERTLWLGRDRLGIKPLYWAQFGQLWLFASELKALRAHPGWTPSIDRSAVASFLRHNYVPGPFSIYQGVRKLQPGHLLRIGPDGQGQDICYWDARQIALDGSRQRSVWSDQAATDALDSLLRDAVGRQMMADVPLGAFLSGGIDSSTVAALMQAQSSQKVRTFSIGFTETGYDESAHARAVAQHLGTDHTQLVLEPSHALDLVPNLAQWWDEPFADSSQLPTFLLAELTRGHVTVALSGDGGDELFAGYNRYFWAKKIHRSVGWLPNGLRQGLGQAIKRVSPQQWDRLASMIPARLPPQVGDKAHKLADVLAMDEIALYRRLVSHWEQPSAIALGAEELRGPIWDRTYEHDFPDSVARMQILDTVTYLPDDILTKVDRATMAVALESRVPLLDHRVMEFAWSLPGSLKIRDGVGKWLLRQVLYRYVPQTLVDRPKMGFGVPISDWLRGPLRPWAEDLFSGLEQSGLVDPAPVRQLWAEHQSGTRNWQYLLWDVLMLESWYQRWMR